MEKIKNSHSLRHSFSLIVMTAILCVILLSLMTIYGCNRIQKYILPDSNEVWLYVTMIMPDGTERESKQRFVLDQTSSLSLLTEDDESTLSEKIKTEYKIEAIESGYAALSPQKKAVYRSSQVSMVAFPLIYSIIGISLSGWWFYRKKIAPPVQILTDATEHIRENDLDFEIPITGQDELGRLCTAFEKMRQTLYENNRQLWGMIEERRILQASVAHDLRNPIAIIEGYVEYMEQNICNGRLSGEKLEHTLANLAFTAKRMERYTDYIRDLNALEETEANYEAAELPSYLQEIVEGLTVIAKQQGRQVKCTFDVPPCIIGLDKTILSRVLENVFVNALRYARDKIQLTFSLDKNLFTVHVVDDGIGFSDKMLNKKTSLFCSEDTTGEHIGLGLAVSRVLCGRHRGSIELSNTAEHGACVKIVITVNNRRT